MIIGSTDFDYALLYKNIKDTEAVVRQAEDMVPIWLQFRKDIVANQRYYVATLIRGCQTIPYRKRKELMDALLENIHISGVITTFVPIDTVFNCIDKDLLIHLLMEVK